MCWVKFSGEKIFFVNFETVQNMILGQKKKIRSLREKKINTPNFNLRIIWVLEIDIGILQLFKVFNFTRTNAFCHLKTLSRSLFPSQIIPHKVLWKLQTIKSKKKWKFAGCRYVVRISSAQRKNIFLLNINIFFLTDVTFKWSYTNHCEFDWQSRDEFWGTEVTNFWSLKRIDINGFPLSNAQVSVVHMNKRYQIWQLWKFFLEWARFVTSLNLIIHNRRKKNKVDSMVSGWWQSIFYNWIVLGHLEPLVLKGQYKVGCPWLWFWLSSFLRHLFKHLSTE